METKQENKKGASQMEEHGMLKEFFVDQLKDIYWAEKALLKSLQKLKEAATSKKLAKAFEKHMVESEGQIEILEQVFELMGEKAQAKKCEAMDGLTKEAESVIEETKEGTYTRDVGLIIASQKAEHYEIASYGSLVILAEQIGESKVAKLLQKILDQEKKTDITLSMIAEDKVNESAAKE